ncbi:protein ENHANCED PSEUDOMONAS SUSCEPTIBILITY 1-like [Primulina eburnea]|uniref:protein ENHANCED PSEUDOMONAS SUSCEPTIBILITY 1-like n=1 Tax=Primulina eburnea TaxID=1245227 RepID=UPI003C6CB764
MSKIEILCSSMVKMASTTVNNGNAAANSKLELTPWDLMPLLICPIQEGLLFHEYPNLHDQFKKTFVDHLKASLSRTLDFFPPLAGRLKTTKNDDGTSSFFVDCNNAGAEFTHASAPGVSVSDILDPIYVPETVYSFFTLVNISNLEGVSKPLLGVQVTELEDGFFIGCSMNHALVDGNSFWHFFNSWSEISRGFETISKIPVFERWFPEKINLPIHIPPLERRNMFSDVDSDQLLQRVFRFSKENIAKLKSRANDEAGTAKISSLQTLLAHIWRSVLRGRRNSSSINQNSENQEIHFFVPVGTRERIPLHNCYFGNASYGAIISSNEDHIFHHGLGYTAMKFHELVSQQTKEQAIKNLEDWAENPTIPSKRLSNNICVVSNSPRYDVYGNDFGWGKPIAVRSGISLKIDGRITVFPAADPGGIDAEAYLAEETLEAMANDAEFMEAVSI